jgi:cell division protein FtsB
VTGWVSQQAGLTCQLRVATLPRTVDDRRALPPTDPPDPDQPDETTSAAVDGADPSGADAIDLSSLSIAGITKRRVGWVCAALAAAWIVAIFARQASEGAAVAGRADEVARDNVALEAEVAALERELRLIKRPAYIAQQARAYDLGSPDEIPFTLDPSVPSPGPDAPGSASMRVGADEERVTPLESWLSLLFGPAD